MKKRNKYKFELKLNDIEVNTEPSQTIQGHAYTIRDLFNNHREGIMPAVKKEPIWQDDTDHDSHDLMNIDKLDPVDKQRIMEMLHEDTDFMKTQINKTNQKIKEELQKRSNAKTKKTIQGNKDGTPEASAASDTAADTND